MLDIYICDVKGRVIKNIYDAKSSAGLFSIIWGGTDKNGQPIASGIFYLHMKTDSYQK